MIPGDSIPSEGNYSELRNLFNSTDENDYKYRTKEMPKQRYDVEKHYEIFSIADKYTGYREAIKNNFEERMEKGKRKQ